jgi:hypothetical protein
LRASRRGWSGHGEEEVAGTGGLDVVGLEAVGDIVVVRGVQVVAVEADVEKADLGILGVAG